MRNMLRKSKKSPAAEQAEKGEVKPGDDKASAKAHDTAGKEPAGALQERLEQAVGSEGSVSGKGEAAASEPRKLAIGTIEAGPLASQSVAFVKPNKYYAIDENELQYLMKFEKPLSLFIASIFAGMFFGLLYPAFQAINEIQLGRGGATIDLFILIFCGMSFGIAIASTFVTLKSKTKVMKALAVIRERTKLYLPPDHPGTPPQGVKD